jgi:hypothetical protein
VVVGDVVVVIVMRERMGWRAEQVPQRQVVGKRREVGDVSSEGRWEGWGGMEAGGRFGGVGVRVGVVGCSIVVVGRRGGVVGGCCCCCYGWFRLFERWEAQLGESDDFFFGDGSE